MSEYLCKDCKYSKIPLTSRIMNTIFFMPNEYFEYRCTRKSKMSAIKFSPVIGQYIDKSEHNKNPYCHNEREEYEHKKDNPEHCGPEGKHWTPKDKKDLFKYLLKVSK